MSMTLSNAQTYIARMVGGQGDSGILSEANDALNAAMDDLVMRHLWSFMRQDTSPEFTVADCDTSGSSTTVTTGTALGFKNVLAGMTVTGTGVPADTTVSSWSSNTTIVLSAAVSLTNITLTFGGTIPILEGTHTYKLPAPFWKPYDCRLVSTVKKRLVYIPMNMADILLYDLTTQGDVSHYTLYNANTFDATGTQQGYIRFFKVPNQDDVALLRYYRAFDPAATTLDVPDRYLYMVLDYARLFLLRTRDATNSRLPGLEDRLERRINRAIAADMQEGAEDQHEAFVSPHEATFGMGFSGDFYPRGDDASGWIY